MTVGILFALVAVLGYTFSTLFITLLKKKAGAVSTQYMLICALGGNILLTLGLTGRIVPAGLTWLQLLFLAVSAILGLTFGFILMAKAIILIGPRLVLLVATTTSAFSFLFGWLFLREKESLISLLYVALIIFGIIIVILNSSPKGRGAAVRHSLEYRKAKGKLIKGILFSLILALFQSAALLLSKLVLKEGFSPIEVNTYRMLFAVIGVVIYVRIAGFSAASKPVSFSRREWIYICLAAAAGPVSAVALNFYSLDYISIGISSAMLQLSPVFMLFFSRLIFKERISPAAVGGTVIAVIGTVLLASA